MQGTKTEEGVIGGEVSQVQHLISTDGSMSQWEEMRLERLKEDTTYSSSPNNFFSFTLGFSGARVEGVGYYAWLPNSFLRA